jgi:hypothetical protein
MEDITSLQIEKSYDAHLGRPALCRDRTLLHYLPGCLVCHLQPAHQIRRKKNKMKALTLYQPWATLVAIGAKRIETRSWSTSYRGPLAIHAGKIRCYINKMSDDCVWDVDPFYKVLADGGAISKFNATEDEFIIGCIVATCELASVIRIDQATYTWASQKWVLNDQERAFGDYTIGRYMWLLNNVKPMPNPIPAKGAMGLWEWKNNE